MSSWIDHLSVMTDDDDDDNDEVLLYIYTPVNWITKIYTSGKGTICSLSKFNYRFNHYYKPITI